MQTKNNSSATFIGGCSVTFIGAVTIISLLFLMMLGAEFLFTIPFDLTFGWIPFTWTKFSQLQLNVVLFLVFLLCLGLFTAGMHASCRWLYAARSEPRNGAPLFWPLKWTFGITGLVLVLFGAGIACIGVAHQSAWLASFKEPWVREMRSQLNKHIHAVSTLREDGIKQNWNTVQMQRKASELVAASDGLLQVVIAVDKNGDWRAILSKFIEYRHFEESPRAAQDYIKGNVRDDDLEGILKYYADDVRPDVTHEK